MSLPQEIDCNTSSEPRSNASLQVRETDLDLLEKVVSMAVYGDLEAEDPGALSPLNFGRICRVAQLTGEYLLHVQDRLALENSQLKVRLTHALLCQT